LDRSNRAFIRRFIPFKKSQNRHSVVYFFVPARHRHPNLYAAGLSVERLRFIGNAGESRFDRHIVPHRLVALARDFEKSRHQTAGAGRFLVDCNFARFALGDIKFIIISRCRVNLHFTLPKPVIKIVSTAICMNK